MSVTNEKGDIGEIYNIAGGFEQKNIDTVKQIIECYGIDQCGKFRTVFGNFQIMLVDFT